MNNINAKTNGCIRRSLRTALSTVVIVIAVGAAMTAMAADRPNEARANENRNVSNGRQQNERNSWQDHERQNRARHRRHPEPEYGVVYAPPPVVYAPPEQSPGLSLVFPLNFR